MRSLPNTDPDIFTPSLLKIAITATGRLPSRNSIPRQETQYECQMNAGPRSDSDFTRCLLDAFHGQRGSYFRLIPFLFGDSSRPPAESNPVCQSGIGVAPALSSFHGQRFRDSIFEVLEQLLHTRQTIKDGFVPDKTGAILPGIHSAYRTLQIHFTVIVAVIHSQNRITEHFRFPVIHCPERGIQTLILGNNSLVP